jgi:hypothetical protein
MSPDPHDPYSQANYQPLTPLECERELGRLSNAVAQAELLWRKALDQEVDARLAYERAHLIASTDPDCPLPQRGGDTVAMRDDWIRGMEFEELQNHELAKKLLRQAQRYQDRLDTQVSIMQSRTKTAMQAYEVAGRS